MSRLVPIGNGIDWAKWNRLVLVLQHHRSLLQKAMCQHHTLACKKTQRHFIGRACHIQRAIASNTTTDAHQQSLLYLRRRRQLQGRSIDFVHPLRRLSHQTGVRCVVVKPTYPLEQHLLELFERANLSKVIEHLTAHRPPEALHLASRLRIVRTRMQQRALQTRAVHRQAVSSIGRAIVQIQDLWHAMPEHSRGKQREHRGFPLVRAHSQCDHIARCIVQQRVNSDRDGLAVQMQRGAMTNVAMPQQARSLGLPSQAGARARALVDASFAQALLVEHSTHGRGFDFGPNLSQCTEIGEHQ